MVYNHNHNKEELSLMRRLRKPICLVAAIVILAVIMTGTVIYVKKTDQSGATYSNPLWEAPDPYVILHDGMYYRTYPAKGNQIVVAVSESLVTRGTPTVVYEFPSGNWNSTAVWAPLALFQWDDGHWYIYYCAVHNGNIDLYGHERRAGAGVLCIHRARVVHGGLLQPLRRAGAGTDRRQP